uniref:Uncharacterized protein n=1 Tax=Anguilla anguilla TaxID=7936 RepID=A0A0E9UQB5_ANGAN
MLFQMYDMNTVEKTRGHSMKMCHFRFHVSMYPILLDLLPMHYNNSDLKCLKVILK